jgi:hypothetical protein
MRTELMTASAGIDVAGVVVKPLNVIDAVDDVVASVAVLSTLSIACALFGVPNWLLVVLVGFHVPDTVCGGWFVPFG